MLVNGTYFEFYADNKKHWGLKVNGKIVPKDDIVVVSRPNGSVHKHKVASILWQKDGVRYCSIVPVTRERVKEVYGL